VRWVSAYRLLVSFSRFGMPEASPRFHRRHKAATEDDGVGISKAGRSKGAATAGAGVGPRQLLWYRFQFETTDMAAVNALLARRFWKAAPACCCQASAGARGPNSGELHRATIEKLQKTSGVRSATCIPPENSEVVSMAMVLVADAYVSRAAMIGLLKKLHDIRAYFAARTAIEHELLKRFGSNQAQLGPQACPISSPTSSER